MNNKYEMIYQVIYCLSTDVPACVETLIKLRSALLFQALAPLGIGVATGEQVRAHQVHPSSNIVWPMKP